MTAAIISLLAGLLGLGTWWVKRRAAKRDNPLEQHRQRYDKVDQDIITGSAAQNGAHLHADLDELERLERLRHTKGQGDQR